MCRNCPHAVNFPGTESLSSSSSIAPRQGQDQDIFPLFSHTEFVAVLSAVAGAGGHGNNVGSAAAAAVVLPRTETGALRQGDRSGGRQRWELGAAIVQIRDWSPDIKTFPHSADITQHMTRCLPECVL